MKDEIRELKQRAQRCLEDAQRVVEAAKAERRDISKAELRDVRRLTEEHDRLMDDASEKEGRSPYSWSGGIQERLDAIGRSDGNVPKPNPGTQREEARGLIRGDSNTPRTFRNLFGPPAAANDGWRSMNEMLQMMAAGVTDQRLQRSMTEGDVSAGGAAVPERWAEQILDAGLEGEIIRPRATVFRMNSAVLHVPAFILGDHGSSLSGVSFYWEGEADTIQESTPETRRIDLHAHKVAGITYTSNELASDGPNLEDQLGTFFGGAVGWEIDNQLLNGDGVGKPLGILNSPCLKVVAKEAGQSADSLVYENLTNMIGGLAPGSFARSMWVASQDVIPALLELSITLGLGAEHVPVLRDDGSGNMTLLTRPLLISEKLPSLGDQGDLCLIDPTKYLVGLRSDVRIDRSSHVKFTTDELAWRVICRLDGQPAWNETRTLANGNEVSPFVTLAARS